MFKRDIIKKYFTKVYEKEDKDYYRLKAKKSFDIDISKDLKIQLYNYATQFDINKDNIDVDPYRTYTRYNFINIKKGDTSGLIHRNAKLNGFVWIDKGIIIDQYCTIINSVLFNSNNNYYTIENSIINKSIISNASIKESLIVNSVLDIINFSRKPYTIYKNNIYDAIIYNTITNTSKELIEEDTDDFKINYNIYNSYIKEVMIFTYDGYINNSTIEECNIECRQLYIYNCNLIKNCNIFNNVKILTNKYLNIFCCSMHNCDISENSLIEGHDLVIWYTSIKNSIIKGKGCIQGKYNNEIIIENSEINFFTDKCTIYSDRKLIISFSIFIGSIIKIIIENNNDLATKLSTIKNSHISSMFNESVEISITGNSIYIDETTIEALQHNINIMANEIYFRNSSVYILFTGSLINNLTVIGSTINNMKIFSAIIYSLNIDIKVEYSSISYMNLVLINTLNCIKDNTFTDNIIKDLSYTYMDIINNTFRLAISKEHKLNKNIIVYNDKYKLINDLF